MSVADMSSIMRVVLRLGGRFGVCLKRGDVDDIDVKSFDGHNLLLNFVNRRRNVLFSYQADWGDVVGAGVDRWRRRSGRMRWKTRSQRE
jgi:hypothetical protein